MLSVSQARDKAEKLVSQARAAGAEAADAIYVGDRSSGVQVRKGALEDVHRSEGEEIGLRVFLGSKSATVASSDLSDEALSALQTLSRLEGIIPALESSHAVAHVLKMRAEVTPDDLIVVNLSGRGDKDMNTVAAALGVTV